MLTIRRATAVLLLFSTMLLSLLVAPIVAKEIAVHDSWDVVLMAGSSVGFVHTEILLREVKGERRYITRIETEIEMMRGSAAARATISNEVTEDEQGWILGFRLKMATSGEPVETAGHLSDGKLKIEQTVLGRTRAFEVKLPDDSIGPYATMRLMKEKGFAPGTKYTIHTFEGQTLKALDIGVEVLGEETIDLFGKRMRLHKLNVKQSILPLMTIHEWCDDDGDIIKTEIKQLAMVTLRTTREDALKASSSPKVDLLRRLSAPCDTIIPHPYLTKAATYRIHCSDGALDFKMPSDEVQTATSREGGVQVKIAPRAYSPTAASSPPTEEASLVEYLTASTYIQSDDARILELANLAIGDEKKPYRAAMLLCKWVSDNISLKDYSVAFATAREVADRLQGDCTEHAVLLAALLRAARIPSRCVVGLVHSNGSFYYHLWNEAFISEWVPLDATLGRGGNYWDAVHIKLGDTSLNSPMPMLDLASILPTMGNIKVEVLSLGFDGRTLDVKEPGKLSFVMGNKYENLLYSFRIEKPSKAVFEEASSPLRSGKVLTVQAPAYTDAELTVEVESVGFSLDLHDLIRGLTASGKEFTKVRYFEIDDRPAVRFVEANGSDRTLKLLIHDRDTLITVRAVGVEKWQKKLFNKATKSFRFTDTE